MIHRNFLINCASVLLCLVPLALLTGPFLPDLFISLISIIFLFYTLKDRNFSYFKNKFFYFFIIFYLFLITSSLLSDNPYLSLESSLFYFRFFIFSLSVWFLIDNNKFLLQKFSIIFIITYLFAILDGIFQIFSINNIFGYECGLRMCLSFNDRMILGSYFVRLLPILLACLLFYLRKNEKKILIISLFLILSNILILMSGERTAMALLLIANILFFFLLDTLKKYRKPFILLIAILIGVVFYINPQIKERQIDYTLSQINFNLSNKSMNIFSEEHEAMLKTSINIFNANKIIGIGPKLFRIKCQETSFSVNDDLSCSTHPHNNYIQALAELGIIGFLFLVSLFFYSLYLILKSFVLKFYVNKRQTNDYMICFYVSFFINLFPFLPTLNLFNNWMGVIYFLPVGFYLHSISLDIKES